MHHDIPGDSRTRNVPEYVVRYLESALISERVKAGMEAAKARGKRFGRPVTPLHIVARIEEMARTTEWNGSIHLPAN